MKQWEPSLFFKVCRLFLRVQIVLGLIIFCYNYFVQAYLGVQLLLFVGWLIGLTGLLFFILGTYDLKTHGEAKKGQSFLLTSVLVDYGIYSVVRHPEYLGSIFLLVGSILISQHWSTLILGIPLLMWFFIYVLPNEDKHLKEKFGDHYLRYMKKVPSINFLVGIIRLIQSRRKN